MSKADCRKFAPNVFNKNKCASCFKAKDEHSDEALENNRASRKVAKCGYLFAAPDWDFSNPINRTKRISKNDISGTREKQLLEKGPVTKSR
ncbi:hypothetical protein DAPPUDRAFT_318415 [Daphnia pulex]|uniref:Protein outspread n=1 Tax=Daphnia pulex TaxID=6669 RepID=E9GIQ8_DAPPU|nr:hypothetical protein DAPPUDRAFT_318415 [Daphnia pulex]|eukprot:EFX80703.1 hypothetical protein DAPPUDRAFT_318415 [Daphnia pulex]